MAIDANGGCEFEAAAGAWTDGDWSWCGWVNTQALGTGNNHGIFVNGQGTTNHFQIYKNNVAQTYNVKSSASDTLSFGAVVVGEWAHLAFVYSSSAPSRTLYLNGVLVTSVGTDFTQTSQTWDLYRIGTNRGGTVMLDGLFDDFRVYRGKLLSAAEVSTIHAARGRDGIVGGLEARWTMSEAGADSAAASLVDSAGGVDLPVTDGSPLYAPSELSLRRRVA